MLTKLARAFSLLRQDLISLKGDVQRIEKVRQVVKHGKDGVSPDQEEIVSAVLERMPAPKDGISPDPQTIAEAAAKLIPEAKPGRDAIPPTVRDVADVVLAKIEKPKDGVSPDPKAIAVVAARLIQKPKDGVSPTAEAVAARLPTPKRGLPGKPGKNGVSITDVQLNNNELFVFLDGKKNSVGKIKVPAATAPFRPGGDGGGGSASSDSSISAIITTMQTRAAMGNTVVDTGVLQAILTGTGNALLPPPATPQPPTGGSYNGYERVAGLVEIAASGELSVSDAAFVIGVNGGGSYRTPHAWVDMSSNTTATTVGFIFGILKASDGLVRYSQRVTGSRMAAQDDRTNTSGGGFVDGLEPGDELSMWVAADKTATITIYDMNIGLEMSIAESLK